MVSCAIGGGIQSEAHLCAKRETNHVVVNITTKFVVKMLTGRDGDCEVLCACLIVSVRCSLAKQNSSTYQVDDDQVACFDVCPRVKHAVGGCCDGR